MAQEQQPCPVTACFAVCGRLDVVDSSFTIRAARRAFRDRSADPQAAREGLTSPFRQGLERQRLIMSRFSVSVLLLLVVLRPTRPIAFAADERDALGVMAQGYLSNREAFQWIRCRFRMIRGRAASVEEALKGNISNPIEYRGLWLVDGPNVRYELVCDPAVLEPALKKLKTGDREEGPQVKEPEKRGRRRVTASLPCSSEYCLKNESYSLGYSPLIAGGNLHPKDSPNRGGIRVTPFSMDVMGPDEMSGPANVLQDCVRGKFFGRFDGREEVRGVEVLVASAGKTEATLRLKYYLDPNRGFLPIYLWDTNPTTGRKLCEAYITDIKECSHGRWFPERSVVVFGVGATPPFKTQEIKVLELDVDNRPSKRDFYLDLPAGTQISIPTRSQWVTFAQDERVGLDDLQRLHQRCIEYPKTLNGLPGAEQPSGLRTALRWTLSVGTLLIVGFVVFMIVRSRLSTSRR